jgi:hypothetical protein
MDKFIQTFLLETDPAIRWQVMRDLLGRSERTWKAERRKVARDGWGAKLLGLQDDSGTWAGKMYSPKWISTTYTMMLLRRLGLEPQHPQALKACKLLLENGLYNDGGITYFPSMPYGETCVTGMVLSLLAYFEYPDEKVQSLVDHLLAQQMPDGGWNCESFNGAKHSSFHTTISVLEGLREWEKVSTYKTREILASRDSAVEFLLQHRLYFSSTDGSIVDEKMTKFRFPWRWKYDVLRALVFISEADVPYDTRIDDALELLLSKRHKDGTWKLNAGYSGRVYFDMEKAGKPSRWITMFGTRVLQSTSI